MVLNQIFRDSQGDHAEFIRLMEAQNIWARDSINNWLTRKPWQYGSIDSADYHQAALHLAAEMTEVMLEGNHEDWMRQCAEQNYLLMNFACDGICPELMEKFPDKEEVN